LLPGTDIHARGLRWEVVSTQTPYRLRELEGAAAGEGVGWSSLG